MRRAQTEMIGLVFVVVILVLGFLLYLKFSSGGGGSVPDQSSTYLVALKETTIPACKTSVERIAAACLEGETLCGDPCSRLEETFRSIAGQTLVREGFRYNLSLIGSVSNSSDCASADPAVELTSAPRAPIVSGGHVIGYLELAMCR